MPSHYRRPKVQGEMSRLVTALTCCGFLFQCREGRVIEARENSWVHSFALTISVCQIVFYLQVATVSV